MSGRLKLQAVVYSTGSYWLLRDDSNIGLIPPAVKNIILAGNSQSEVSIKACD